MSKLISLALQLAQLDQPAPVDFDPEDAAKADGELEDASAQVGNAAREHYLDVGTSSLRSKAHESISDPKYDGVRISRKQLQESDEEELSDDVPDALLEPMNSDEEGENSEEEESQEGSNSDTRPPLKSPSDPIPHTVPTPNPSEANDPSSTLKRAREEERKKGKAVARQLAMYDSLLDARIRLQKCVTSMNRLPDAPKIPEYLTAPESRAAADKLISESLSLADDLSELQEKLMSTNESIDPPARKRRKVGTASQVDRDWEEELQESSAHFADLESTFHPHLLTTLQKWSNKVLAIAPSALLPSNRTKFSAKNANQVKSAVQLVDEALLERSRLVERTRVWRGKDARLGVDPASTAAVNSEKAKSDVFDDTDFYQALLRSVIDSRSGSHSNAGADLAADWRATQQQRKTARKRAVDTRASKGRKLRFEVHEKLQNFMAPMPAPLPSGANGGAWHEAQIDELFAALLGKGFGGDAGEEEERADMDIDVGKALGGGFRVFG